jgi:hypothetical protein
MKFLKRGTIQLQQHSFFAFILQLQTKLRSNAELQRSSASPSLPFEICIACGIEDESAFHLLSDCSSLIYLYIRMRTFSKLIPSVEEYEGASASALL